MRIASLLILLFAARFAAAQQQSLAVIAQVKKGVVELRWAPASAQAWNMGNTYGYKIERAVISDSKAAVPDSLQFKNAEVLAAALPWQRGDARWKTLLEKNKAAAFLYNSLYPAKKPKAGPQSEMAFAMLMKACDLDRQLSSAHCLIFTDSSIRAGEKYRYRVTIGKPGARKPAASAVITVNTANISGYAALNSLNAKFGDRRAVLSFVTLGNNDYAGYWIERSEDSVHYAPVHKSPFIRATTKYDKDKRESTYGDSLPVNDKRYYYRVRGITCFGEPGPPSNVVSGMGKTSFKEYPLIDSAILVKNASVKLQFHIPAEPGITVYSFFVARSEKRNGSYAFISPALSPQTNTFVDPQPLVSNYYKVYAINQYSDTAVSLAAYIKVIDETPPAVPDTATGSIDSNGVAKISWAANTEPDLLGYRVYRSNSPNEQPFELTKRILTEPAFTDTISLNTLTRYVYYSVRAVDKVYNNSNYSVLCKLARPDKIAPVAVTFSKVNPTDTSIQLSWNNSSSSDVSRYALFRKEGSGDWIRVSEWPAGENRSAYNDVALVPEKNYQYRVDVLDESGNSASATTHSVLYKPLFYPRIRPFSAVVDRGKRQVELQWITDNARVYNFTIYKAKAGSPLQVFKTVSGSSSFIIDQELYPNNKYRYAIKATMKNGSETKLSEVIDVDF